MRTFVLVAQKFQLLAINMFNIFVENVKNSGFCHFLSSLYSHLLIAEYVSYRSRITS